VIARREGPLPAIEPVARVAGWFLHTGASARIGAIEVHARTLRDSDHPSIGQIPDVNKPDDRSKLGVHKNDSNGMSRNLGHSQGLHRRFAATSVLHSDRIPRTILHGRV
jgi:hypothetical protein